MSALVFALHVDFTVDFTGAALVVVVGQANLELRDAFDAAAQVEVASFHVQEFHFAQSAFFGALVLHLFSR